MNAFYNLNGVGDVLIVQLTPSRPEAVTTKTTGDVTLVYDESTTELVGFNLFKAASYIKLDEVGRVDLTPAIVEQIQEALHKNEAGIDLNADLSPKFVVGHVVTKEKHPNADKLNICTVDVGDETVQIVCGAANVEAGQKVVVAKVGAVMPSGMVIRDAELRGVASAGMICSAKELALPNAPEAKGILVLDDNAVAGEAFSK
ncbi:YtpR family tRNA-binding protein [Sporosarcina sp. FSL K6-1522]|uniref:YtpR family tRNA-binding protein n=1 Tax=Sporosarcina sp. FSL K6-1522 TaxID=2921554 RepID=UPI00315B0E89